MIINKVTKQSMSRNDKPNENWLDNEWAVIPDNSEMAMRFNENYPYVDIELDDEGNIVDIIPREKTETEIKQDRLSEIQLELEQFDKTVDRQWEDYYIKEKITPVERIAVVIKQKETLRLEYQAIKQELKEGESVETDNEDNFDDIDKKISITE